MGTAAIESVLLIASALIVVSIFASKAAVRLGLPALLLFVGIGMLAGSDGPGGIYFDHPWATQFVGVSALAVILFAAGFETDWASVRPVIWKGISLSTIGVAVSTFIVGLFSAWILGWSLLQGLLLGAIISSTDAAAVFNLLRARRLHLRDRLGEILELESGSNDPIAVLLTLALIEVLLGRQSTVAGIVWFAVVEVVLGALIGYLAGRLLVFTINRAKLEWEGLYPVLSITAALLIYGVTASIHGNGFLAVYLAGIIAGNRTLVHRQRLRVFHDGVAWLLQIAMFLVLGLQVFPSRLGSVLVPGVLISALLIFIARPVSVFVALAFSGLSIRHQLLISLAGLRGAAPIVLATFPLLARIPHADTIFHVVFFVALSSLLLQGTLVPRAATLFKLDQPEERHRRFPLIYDPATPSDGEVVELRVAEQSPAAGKRIVDLNLPTGILVVLVNRDNQFVIPQGSTILKPGDITMLLASREHLKTLHTLFETAVHQPD